MKIPRDIRERTFEYALRTIRLYAAICKVTHPAGIVLGKQQLRAATSVGANLEEAYAAQSRRDFAHKCRIALKEARESLYWLRLIYEANVLPQAKLNSLIAEANELIAILTSIVKKTTNGLESASTKAATNGHPNQKGR